MECVLEKASLRVEIQQRKLFLFPPLAEFWILMMKGEKKKYMKMDPVSKWTPSRSMWGLERWCKAWESGGPSQYEEKEWNISLHELDISPLSPLVQHYLLLLLLLHIIVMMIFKVCQFHLYACACLLVLPFSPIQLPSCISIFLCFFLSIILLIIINGFLMELTLRRWRFHIYLNIIYISMKNILKFLLHMNRWRRLLVKDLEVRQKLKSMKSDSVSKSTSANADNE